MNTNVVGFESLSKDLITSKVMPNLSIQDCGAMAKTCRAWRRAIIGTCTEATKQVLSPMDQKLYDTIVFGKKDWEQYGIEVGEEPPITWKIRLLTEFKGLCPFFNEPDPIQPHRFQGRKNNRMWETFKVILIPNTVDINDIGITFSFEKTEKKANDDGTVFSYIAGDQNSDYRTEKAPKSKYLKVALDVIPRSRKTTYEKKVELLEPKGYRVPTPLEAVIKNVVLNIGPSKDRKGYFFPKGGNGQYWTYTATDTLFNNRRLVVGAASAAGPLVFNFYAGGDFSNVGVAAVAEVL
jgi:effector-binding domain-containing protein